MRFEVKRTDDASKVWGIWDTRSNSWYEEPGSTTRSSDHVAMSGVRDRLNGLRASIAIHEEQLDRIKQAAVKALRRTNCDRIISIATKARRDIRISPQAFSDLPDEPKEEEVREWILAHIPDLTTIALWAWYELQKQKEAAK